MTEHPLKGIENDIPYEAAYRANAGTSFCPEKRAEDERRQYADHLAALWEQLDKIAETDEQRAVAVAQFARYREGFRKRYLAMLGARSRVVSTMIAGPANFPVRQMAKRNRSADNRMKELTDYTKRIRDKVIAAVHAAAPAAKKRNERDLVRYVGEAATLTINHERGGVELTFPSKPDEDIRSRLKAAGFRWSGRQGLWYARLNERTLAVAREVAGARLTSRQEGEGDLQ